MAYSSFMTFLKNRMNTPEVSDILSLGIEEAAFPETVDVNNLFAVTPHFLKTCPGEAQKVLEALLIAYNRWILTNLKEVSEGIERCATANRVIFIEDRDLDPCQVDTWKGVNGCMEYLSSTVEDLSVQTNYLVSQRRVTS